MDLDNQITLGHLFFTNRNCRTCGKQKNLLEDFYRIRKGSLVSSYSYECKECTKERIIKNRKNKFYHYKTEYPDW
jgi:hypothetical protein